MNILRPIGAAAQVWNGCLEPTLPRIVLEVHHSLSVLAEEWASFEARAAGTFYQTYSWCAAWQATVGAEMAAEPCIVAGRDSLGRLQFLLPWCTAQRGGSRVLQWLAGEQIGYGYGLYDRRFLPAAADWFAHEGWRVLEAAGPIDAVLLEKMPDRLHGFPHPLSAWFSIAGRNASYRLDLARPFEELYAAKRSAETRRGNRKRDAKLAAFGELEFGLPATAFETHAVLDDMFDQQQARLAAGGIRGVFGDGERRFIHRLATLRGSAGPALLPFRLTIGADTAAVMLGGFYDNCYWALISSVAETPYLKHSPGDAALRRLIEACAEMGFAAIDFGSGDAPYKLHWADAAVPLHDGVRAITARGYVWSLAALAALAAKRAVKRTPPLWRTVSWLRRKAVRR